MLCGAALASCARPAQTTGTADLDAWNAWVQVHKEDHPDYLWNKTPLGSYILEDDRTGTVTVGPEVIYPYVNVEYTIRNHKGQVQSTTDKTLSQRLGTYVESEYYGARCWRRGEGYLAAGLEEIITGLKVGQKVKAVVPQWLNTVSRYSTPEEYRQKYTDGATFIYDLKVTQIIGDLDEYQTGIITSYLNRRYGAELQARDSIAYGCYYHRLKEPTDTAAPENGKSVTINYVGRLLNGQVFDTTLKDTAKVHNIYSAESEYGPVKVNWTDSWDTITMGNDESSLIEGFKRGIYRMRVGEKGVVGFISAIGYGAQDLGSTVPAYSPMLFEIEVLSKQ